METEEAEEAEYLVNGQEDDSAECEVDGLAECEHDAYAAEDVIGGDDIDGEDDEVDADAGDDDVFFVDAVGESGVPTEVADFDADIQATDTGCLDDAVDLNASTALPTSADGDFCEEETEGATLEGEGDEDSQSFYVDTSSNVDTLGGANVEGEDGCDGAQHVDEVHVADEPDPEEAGLAEVYMEESAEEMEVGIEDALCDTNCDGEEALDDCDDTDLAFALSSSQASYSGNDVPGEMEDRVHTDADSSVTVPPEFANASMPGDTIAGELAENSVAVAAESEACFDSATAGESLHASSGHDTIASNIDEDGDDDIFFVDTEGDPYGGDLLESGESVEGATSLVNNEDDGAAKAPPANDMNASLLDEQIVSEEMSCDVQNATLGSSADNLEGSQSSCEAVEVRDTRPASKACTAPSTNGRKRKGAAGYIFLCSKKTQRECETLRVLGSPNKDLSKMKDAITQDTQIFLLNFETLRLMGTFVPYTDPDRDIVKGAFGGRFPAQVGVMAFEGPVRESQLRHRIPDGPKTEQEVSILKEQLIKTGVFADARVQTAWGADDLQQINNSVIGDDPTLLDVVSTSEKEVGVELTDISMVSVSDQEDIHQPGDGVSPEAAHNDAGAEFAMSFDDLPDELDVSDGGLASPFAAPSPKWAPPSRSVQAPTNSKFNPRGSIVSGNAAAKSAAKASAKSSQPSAKAPAKGSQPSAKAPAKGSQPPAKAPAKGSQPFAKAPAKGSQPFAKAPAKGSQPLRSVSAPLPSNPSASQFVGSQNSAQTEESGYVFYCSTATQQDCERLKLFGSPDREMNQMKQFIKPGSKLFLCNIERLKLMGPFYPNSAPAQNIIKGAFGGKFTAQVRVMAPTETTLMEAQLERKVPAGPKNAGGVKSLMASLLKGEPAQRKIQEAWSGAIRADPSSVEPAAKRSKTEKLRPALDKENREYNLGLVVVNFANVGATYATKVLGRGSSKGDRLFDWEGVRKCVRYIRNELDMQVVGCIYENYWGPDNDVQQVEGVPEDIRRLCLSIQETPRLTGKNHKSADDEMTIKCAYRRNCRFMDNDNYRDWLQELRDTKVRRWLENCQELLQMRYFFDTDLGSFDTLDGNVPVGLLADKTL